MTEKIIIVCNLPDSDAYERAKAAAEAEGFQVDGQVAWKGLHQTITMDFLDDIRRRLLDESPNPDLGPPLEYLIGERLIVPAGPPPAEWKHQRDGLAKRLRLRR